MTILFTQYWDVTPGRYDSYSTFICNDYNPAMARLGIEVIGGFYVAVGEGPRIVAVSAVERHETLINALIQSEYRIISNRLFEFVCNYRNRVWVPSGNIQEAPYRIQTGAWKFNHYYNVLPGKEKEHYEFVKNECLPGMKSLGVPVTGGWRLAVGSGPRMLAECTARNIEQIAKTINTSEFRRLVRTLKKEYITDYSSRILAPTGRIEVPFIMKEMMKGF
ncbi:MAG: hypothetical protein AB1659_10300 [Thermodesulfobacteriota bacterium]